MQVMKRLRAQLQQQAETQEQMQQEIAAPRGAQSEAAGTLQEVRMEMAMQAGATILQAHSSGMFSAEAFLVPLEQLVEVAALSLDDVSVADKPVVTAAKRWTLKLAGRDARQAAWQAGMCLAALRDGNGWKTVAGEMAPLFVAPDESGSSRSFASSVRKCAGGYNKKKE